MPAEGPCPRCGYDAGPNLTKLDRFSDIGRAAASAALAAPDLDDEPVVIDRELRGGFGWELIRYPNGFAQWRRV